MTKTVPDITLTQTRIRAGTWEGILTGPTLAPQLEVLHLGVPLIGVEANEIPGKAGEWAVQVPIPLQALTEGVQTFVIRDVRNGETLAHFTVITGVAMDDDLRAEIDLLRAELDLLKRAFRRHCVETSG
jgi:hypothetical protein